MNIRILALIAAMCPTPFAKRLCSAAEPYPNRLANAGFEKAQGKNIPSWAGAIESVAGDGVAHSGRRCARMPVKPKARSRSAVMRSNARGMYYTADARHRFAVWAKGRGRLRLGYDTCPQQPKGSPYIPYMWQREETRLTDEWQQIVHDFSILDPRSARRINVCVELLGDGAEVYLDDASLALAPPSIVAIDVFPFHGMVAKGKTIDIEIRVAGNDKTLLSGGLKVVTQTPDGKVRSDDLAVAASGLTKYPFTAPADAVVDAKTGLFYRFLVSHPESGEARFCSVEIVTENTYAAFESAARKAKLQLPAHVLFIGDSLSDGYRGFNYADKVGFWLRKVNGPRASYKNVGVGGDFITRVWHRLSRPPRVYRLHAYERIFEPRPTHVFIFLGHNDSKVHSKRGTTCVPRDRFQKEMRLAIQKIRADTAAKVIVMSSSSSAYEVICKRWPQLEKARPKGFSKFGIPEVMEEFNAMMRKAADETGAAYLDVYEPTKKHPDKPSLFTADGVHVNNKGNCFLALEILKSLEDISEARHR